MPALPSWLLKIVRFAMKRPSDAQIRAIRVVFALALAAALAAAHGRYTLLPAAWAQYDSAAQWTLLLLAFPSLWTGLTGACVAKKKTVRLGQMILAVALFTLGGWLMRDLPSTEAVVVPAPGAPAAAAQTGATDTGTVVVKVSFAQAAQGSAPAAAASGATPFAQAVDGLAAKAPAAPLPVGLWISLLAWLPLAAGATGKMVTAKCQKYGEKITKVRV